MTNNLRYRITRVLSDHGFIPVNHSSIGSEDHCVCGFRPRGWREWSNHVSDAVIAELEADYILVPKSHVLARRIAAWQLTRWGIENQPDDD